MIRRLTLTLAALALFAAVSPETASAAPKVLERTGNWEMNYSEQGCHLSGAFGAGEDRLLVRFSRYRPGDGFDLNIFGNPLKSNALLERAEVDFGPVENPRSVRTFNGVAGGMPMTMLDSHNLAADPSRAGEGPRAPITAEQEAAVSWLTVRIDGRRNFRFQLGSMAAPMRAMRLCIDDLQRHLGVDSQQQAAIVRKLTPIGNPGAWATTNDYPPDLLRRGVVAIVNFRLVVDESGLPIACATPDIAQPAELASLTCRLMMARARFRPALDAQNRPVRTFYSGRVNWIPPDFEQ